jgi:hypothetical protein
MCPRARRDNRPQDHPVRLQTQFLGAESAASNFGSGYCSNPRPSTDRPRWTGAGFAGAAVYTPFGAAAGYSDWVGALFAPALLI